MDVPMEPTRLRVVGLYFSLIALTSQIPRLLRFPQEESEEA